MKLIKGEIVKEINLPTINNTTFKLSSLKGQKVLLTFYRFASCPFCNLRLHQIAKKYNELNGLVHVAVFSASVEQLNRHTSRYKDLFPILADEAEDYYRTFEIKRSVPGMLRGMFGKMHWVIKSMFMGNIPSEVNSRMLIMPLDILINENGEIEEIHYGKDEGDHIPIEKIIRFAN